MSVSDLRQEYTQAVLIESEVAADPISQFRAWFELAVSRGLPEPNSMTLATASAEGIPSARIVLLKGYDDRGFTFFTNYESRKGAELTANPKASLVFFYPSLERQIRVDGAVERVSGEESDDYFRSRPEGSQRGAWASHQSCEVSDRGVVEARLKDLERHYAGKSIPRPPHWGGFRVVPDRVEFWQGRPNRLHDRLVYTREDAGGWKLSRLEP